MYDTKNIYACLNLDHVIMITMIIEDLNLLKPNSPSVRIKNSNFCCNDSLGIMTTFMHNCRSFKD